MDTTQYYTQFLPLFCVFQHKYIELWLRYRPPYEAHITRVGRQFRVSKASAKSIGSSFQKTFLLNKNTSDAFVFLTALTDDHIDESLDAVAGIQTLFPTHRIVVYDLGLSDDNIETVNILERYIGIMFDT